MGAHNAPAWLVPAFVRSATALGATAPRDELEAEAESLLEMWSTPDRHHHGVSHLASVLERVDQLGQETHNPDLVRLAGWYHGVVFDTEMVRHHRRAAGENKHASAALAERHLRRLGIDDSLASRVRDLILDLTRHDPDPFDVDACALCDADLSILAVEPQRYKAYRERVREEFAHIPARDYLESRMAIISKLLAREQIFTSPLAHDWEEPARQNLEAELARLRVEYATLPPREDGTDPVVEAPVHTSPKESPVDDAVLLPSDSHRHHRAERFATDPTASGRTPRVAPAPTTAEVAQVASDLGHITKPSVNELRDADLSDADLDEIAECIGIPFEEQDVSRPTQLESGALSAMEHDPLDPSNLPRRVADSRDTSELPRFVESAGPEDPSEGDDDAQPPARPTVERVSLRERGVVPTNHDGDEASTGTLFRPVEP